jgi:hypothetical protein
MGAIATSESNFSSGIEGLTNEKSFSHPDQSILPVEIYIERLNKNIQDFSDTIYISSDIFPQESIENTTLDELPEWFSSVRFTEKTPKKVNIPYWGLVDIPPTSELGDLDKKDFTSKEVLGRLFLAESILNTQVFEDNEMKFKELIGDVFPGLEPGMKEITKYLDLAVSNPKRFEQRFGSKESNGESLGRLLVKNSSKLAATSSLAIAMVLLSGCNTSPVEADPVPIVQTLEEDNEEPEVSPTFTATPTQAPTTTPTQEPSPTPTITQEPTPTRIPLDPSYDVRGFGVADDWEVEYGVFESILVVEEAHILDNMESTNDGTFVEIVMKLYGIDVRAWVRADDSYILKIGRTADENEETHISSAEDLRTALNTVINSDDVYGLNLSVEDYPTFTEELINQYVNGDIELDFIMRAAFSYAY